MKVDIIKTRLKYNVYKDWPKQGVDFVDLTPSLLDNDTFQYLIIRLSSMVPDGIDYIVSPESRGFIWGGAVASELQLPFIPLRKKGKLPHTGCSYSYNTEYSEDTLEIPTVDLKNKKCFFIDDILATAGTYKAARTLVEAMNGTLVGGAVIYNLGLRDIMRVKQLYYKDLPTKE